MKSGAKNKTGKFRGGINQTIEKEVEGRIEQIIDKYLPKTFYSGLEPEIRLRYLVEHWQNAIRATQKLERKLDDMVRERLLKEDK